MSLCIGETGVSVDAKLMPDRLDRMLAYAAEVLRQHVPDPDGRCRGCLSVWGRLVFIEQCTQRQWASAVYAAYVQGASTTGPAVGVDHDREQLDGR